MDAEVVPPLSIMTHLMMAARPSAVEVSAIRAVEVSATHAVRRRVKPGPGRRHPDRLSSGNNRGSSAPRADPRDETPDRPPGATPPRARTPLALVRGARFPPDWQRRVECRPPNRLCRGSPGSDFPTGLCTSVVSQGELRRARRKRKWRPPARRRTGSPRRRPRKSVGDAWRVA